MKYSLRYSHIGYRVDVVNEDGTVVKSFHAVNESDAAYNRACKLAEEWARVNNTTGEVYE